MLESCSNPDVSFALHRHQLPHDPLVGLLAASDVLTLRATGITVCADTVRKDVPVADDTFLVAHVRAAADAPTELTRLHVSTELYTLVIRHLLSLFQSLSPPDDYGCLTPRLSTKVGQLASFM